VHTVVLCERLLAETDIWRPANGCEEAVLLLAERRGRAFQGTRKYGLRHPALGRCTYDQSGTGHGDGDNDAGIRISSSYEHYTRVPD
jgi:hypothetical protein